MFVRSARTLGMLLREQRRRQGLTQAQLARRAGVSRQWLNGVEGGREGAELGRVLRTLATAASSAVRGTAFLRCGSGRRHRSPSAETE